MFEKEFSTAISLAYYPMPTENPVFIPYNILICKYCKTYQNKYLGDLSLIYQKNHIDSFGKVKREMHETFANFILKTEDITGILEVGASTDTLASYLLSSFPYSVCDPAFTGDLTRITVFPMMFEALDLNTVQGNTIVMSNVLEHFYDPVEVISKIQQCKTNKYIFINHPNFDFACKNDIPALLNIEHTFYIENEFLVKLFEGLGYVCKSQLNYETHTVCFKFERTHTPTSIIPVNVTSVIDVPKFFENKLRKVRVVNELLGQYKSVYMWPASSHTVELFTFGLNYTQLAGLLDNSPVKFFNYCYGYNVKCFPFKDTLMSASETTCIILGGSDCYLKELDVSFTKAKIVYLHEF
jgi:hypothetical protein